MCCYRIKFSEVLIFILLLVILKSVSHAVVYVKWDSTGPVLNGDSWETAYHSVQQGIDDAAGIKDEVWVARGTYYERLMLTPGIAIYGGFQGNEHARTQRDWSANRTIINGSFGNTVVQAAADSTVDGFTITNASYGVSCDSCSPTISHNTINRISYIGIYCQNSYATITDNTIDDNGGFGIASWYGGPVIKRNFVSRSYTYPAGILCSDNATIFYNVIDRNSGSGVLVQDSGSRIAYPTIACNIIAHNQHGIYVASDHAIPLIVNNTISDQTWYGLYLQAAGVITNNIVTFNRYGIRRSAPGALLSFNDVYSNSLGDYFSITTPGVNDISVSPEFIAAGDYHLSPTSPCIDKGDDSAVQAGWLDIDGQPRIHGPRIDMGADEYWPPVTRVSIDIKPGEYPNCINLSSRGVIPVAILTTDDFDATTVDPASVQLAGSSIAIRGKGDRRLCAEDDIDGDGDTDLVVKVETENLNLEAGATTAILTGKTYDGLDIEGSDDIVIVPPQ